MRDTGRSDGSFWERLGLRTVRQKRRRETVEDTPPPPEFSKSLFLSHTPLNMAISGGWVAFHWVRQDPGVLKQHPSWEPRYLRTCD